MFASFASVGSGCALIDGRPFLSGRGRKSSSIYPKGNNIPANAQDGSYLKVKVFARQNNRKKITRTLQSTELPIQDFVDISSEIAAKDYVHDTSIEPAFGKELNEDTPIASYTRSSVLKACAITSGSLLTIGFFIRQASYFASAQGWTSYDAAAEVSFNFELWHIELIMGLVGLVTSCRYILLKTWPNFAESSEAANEQVLSPLEPLDYIIVAFLPGISEELLFRGALLPVFGLTWQSALITGAVFGALHLGSGRKYSFVVWTTFVGFAYGLSTIISSSIIVPMASHALNNLAGAALWFYTAKQQKKNK